MKRKTESRSEEVEDAGSTKIGCHEPSNGLCLAGRVKCLSTSGSPGHFDARELYSSTNVLTVALEMTSSTTEQKTSLQTGTSLHRRDFRSLLLDTGRG